MTDREIPYVDTNDSRHERYDNLVSPRTRLEILRSSVRRHDFFAGDDDDEFQLARPDGTHFGIFKVWAPNVIPELEGAVTPEQRAKWASIHRDNPLSTYECLESWRAFSEVSDRRLQEVFAARPIPTDGRQAVAELFARLDVAFAFAAPFYNIEALVADHRSDQSDNPVSSLGDVNGGGTLDAIAMLLPSAFDTRVATEAGKWKYSNWTTLRGEIRDMKQAFLDGRQTESAEEFRTLSRIADLAGLNTEDVLFAANALQAIDADVGGKRGDLSPDAARIKIGQLLDRSAGALSSDIVGRDANALIRFKNWTPVLKNDTNFKGGGWAYDAVCSSANVLQKMLCDNPKSYLTENSASLFTEHVVPQMEQIDAASARGRLLMQMLFDGDFNESTMAEIQRNVPVFSQEIIASVEKKVRTERMVNVTASLPTYLVGGKAYGLRTAIELFGANAVHGGSVITSEAVREWLDGDELLSNAAASLKQAESIDEALEISRHIRSLIATTHAPRAIVDQIMAEFGPNGTLALRSSSFDEDVAVIGPAPGIYESVIGCPTNDPDQISDAIKEVVSSFYSDKAVSYRATKGLRHEPLFAVLVQEFIASPGGTIFKDTNGVHLNIASQPDKINDVNDTTIEEYFIDDGDLLPTSTYMNSHDLTVLIAAVNAAYDLYGPSDIEYVLDPRTNKIKILQMRSLHRPEGFAEVSNVDRASLEQIHISDLDNLPIIADSSTSINLVIDSSINLEAFQGILFRWIVTHSNAVKAVTTAQKLPETCHFVNIVKSFGIAVYYTEDD